jgi:FkbM family methyltransferase
MNYKLINDSVVGNIESILDIGAHQGVFTKEMYYYFPHAHYHMIEANEYCEPYLKQITFANYTICLLSDQEKNIIYYVNKNDITSTGNSYYKELTEHFTAQNCIEVMKKSTTLDKLFINKSFDFIKIDTQGSELDILKGGKQLIDRAKYLLLECSVEPYNKEAPLIEEVLGYMDSIGFQSFNEVGNHIYQSKVYQKDLLFKNIKQND